MNENCLINWVSIEVGLGPRLGRGLGLSCSLGLDWQTCVCACGRLSLGHGPNYAMLVLAFLAFKS